VTKDEPIGTAKRYIKAGEEIDIYILPTGQLWSEAIELNKSFEAQLLVEKP
jgi:hypothetical protein